MPAEFSILLFNMALYYSATGFWLKLLSGIGPSYSGFILLIAGSALSLFLFGRAPNPPVSGSGTDTIWFKFRRMIPLFLPVLSIPLSIYQDQDTINILIPFLHILPVWWFTAYMILRGNIYMDRDEMKDRFFLGLRLLLIILPGFFAGSKAAKVLVEVIPYIIVMLAAGVIALRMLRDDVTKPRRQVLILGLIIVAGALLSYFNILSAIGKGIGLIYDKIIAPLIYAVAIVISYIIFGILDLFRRLFISLGFRNAENLPELNDINIITEESSEQVAEIRESPALKIVGILILSAVIIWFLYYLFKRLSQGMKRNANRTPHYISGRESVDATADKFRPWIFRPRDPRMAIRYYFRKYMMEARNRGASITPGSTSEEIVKASVPFFPEDVFDSAEYMRTIYSSARYSMATDISPRDVKEIKSRLKKLTQK